MIYNIAYKDKDGSDFNGLPWIIGGSEDIKHIKDIANEMQNRGYLNVIVFEDVFSDNEEITWDFVNEHKVE